MDKIAIYCRSANHSDEAIESQKNLCLNFIMKKYPNLDSLKIVFYIDNGFPAYNDFAPDMKRLITDLKNNEIKEVYTTRLDRISRNFLKLIDISVLLKENKKDIYYVYTNDSHTKTVLPLSYKSIGIEQNSDELERDY